MSDSCAPSACVNAHLSGGAAGAVGEGSPTLDLLFESHAMRERRLSALRHAFPNGAARVVAGSQAALMAHAMAVKALRESCSGGGGGGGSSSDGVVELEALGAFDADAMDAVGQSVWLSRMVSPPTLHVHAHVHAHVHVMCMCMYM